jgi:hypothetical protein
MEATKTFWNAVVRIVLAYAWQHEIGGVCRCGDIDYMVPVKSQI